MELAKIFINFSLVESSEDYINDDDEPAPFVIMPPPSNNTEVNTACKYVYHIIILLHVRSNIPVVLWI